MSGSLKEQLLALGLKSSTADPKAGKAPPRRRNKRAAARDDITLDQAFRAREQEERRARREAQAEKREQERRRRQVNQKIRSLVEKHAVRDDAADCKRHFLYKGRIRSVLATAEQIRAINRGELGVVHLRGNYHLLPAEQVLAVRQFAPEHVPDLEGQEVPEEERNHPVPDDLIW
ncbi:MAG: DUF2058 family protein [Lysobacterales bacterium]|jgi:uncharacterized protein YaiL (DUF2058 family)